MAKFIVIDGLDGCGKATQTELLRKELMNRGKKVKKVSFPDYDSSSSSSLVKMYLSGEMGCHPTEINPYVAGSFYTMDRAIQYMTKLHEYFKDDDNTIIMADRYTSANVIHQASKIKDKTDRHKYIDWLLDFEYNRCNLPVEDITIVLSIDPIASSNLLSERYKGDESLKDIHESDLEYQESCQNCLNDSIEYINNQSDKTWVKLICCDSEHQIDTVGNIHSVIMWYVDKILNNEVIIKNNRKHITKYGIPE
jgi:dTMP kinase